MSLALAGGGAKQGHGVGVRIGGETLILIMLMPPIVHNSSFNGNGAILEVKTVHRHLLEAVSETANELELKR